MPPERSPEDVRRAFAGRLRRERILANLTQGEFAEAVGVGVDAVSSWERGIKFPRPVIRRRLVRAFPGLSSYLDGDE